MFRKVEGVIISTVDYKESSKIINIFTKESGILGVLAKGCKNPKNKLAATSSPLTYGIFYLKQYGDGIPLLIEVDIMNSFKKIRTDLIKLNYSLFLLELSSQVYKHSDEFLVFPLLIDGLKKIEENYSPRIITNILELKFLNFLGIKPIIDKCVSCGNKENIITISSYKGGYLCQNCLEQEPIYNLKTIKLIRILFNIDIEKISKIEVSDIVQKELSIFIDDYYERYSGLYLKSKNFLQEFSCFEFETKKMNEVK